MTDENSGTKNLSDMVTERNSEPENLSYTVSDGNSGPENFSCTVSDENFGAKKLSCTVTEKVFAAKNPSVMLWESFLAATKRPCTGVWAILGLKIIQLVPLVRFLNIFSGIETLREIEKTVESNESDRITGGGTPLLATTGARSGPGRGASDLAQQ